MKIPNDLYYDKQLAALKKAGIVLDFEKDYTDSEIVDIEGKLQDACLDYGFENGVPNKDCAFWEKITDAFQDTMDS